MRAQSSETGRRGVSLILTAAVLCTILPIIGLAIDVSLLYSTKARLSAAVDAAALAGARSLNQGTSLAAQADAAQATATKFFNANFPIGAMGTSNRVVTPTIAESGYRTRTVSIDASVDAPTYFLRMLGFTSTRLRATGMASRRDVNLVLVLDRSGSMVGAMAPMIAAARGFVGKFAEGRDNVGLVVFSGTTIVAFPSPSPSGPQSNFKTASPSVDTLLSQTISKGSTASGEALWLAYQELVKRNEPGALNLIVFFTDGVPEALAARFNDPDPAKNLFKPTSPCIYRIDDGTHPIRGYICPAGAATWGVLRPNGDTVSTVNEVVTTNSGGCNYYSNKANMFRDVARMPAEDLYGNSLTGYHTVDLTQVSTAAQIKYAALNAADSSVMRMRQDANVVPILYAIGYDGGANRPDEAWLKRIANDPTSPDYDRTKPQGMYVKAPTASDLDAAFATVASEILRLAL